MKPMCLDNPAHLIASWLTQRVDEDALGWLTARRRELATRYDATALALAFSACARRFSKQALSLDAQELAQADELVPGWQPQCWTQTQAARVCLLDHLRILEAEALVAELDQFAACADLDEHIALASALCLLPHNTALIPRARECLRSNVQAIFEAAACDNPFPAYHFDDEAWNQMILKALFIGSDTRRIHALESRHNPQLAIMLAQYAKERRAASRPISHQLWRFLAPHRELPLVTEILSATEGIPAHIRAGHEIDWSTVAPAPRPLPERQ